MARVIAAFLMAPALAIALMVTLINIYYSPADGLLFLLTLLAVDLAYASVVVIGIPLFWVLFKKRLLTLATCIAFSFICSLVALWFYASPLTLQSFQQHYLSGLFAFGIAITAGALFWLIGVRNNDWLNKPDKSPVSI